MSVTSSDARRSVFPVTTPTRPIGLSTRCADGQAKSFSGGGHPLVVRDDTGEVVAEQLCGCQMNGIETPQHTAIQQSRRVEQLLIELNQIEPPE